MGRTLRKLQVSNEYGFSILLLIQKSLRRSTRYWLLLMTLIVPLVIGYVAWELLTPVSLLHRGWAVIAGTFLLDVFVTAWGWCGHLCPMEAFYSLIGKFAPVRIEAAQKERCNDCMDCFEMCARSPR